MFVTCVLITNQGVDLLVIVGYGHDAHDNCIQDFVSSKADLI